MRNKFFGPFGRFRRLWGWIAFRFAKYKGKGLTTQIRPWLFIAGGLAQIICPSLVAYLNENAKGTPDWRLIALPVIQAFAAVMLLIMSRFTERNGLSESAVRRRCEMSEAMRRVPFVTATPIDLETANRALEPVCKAVEHDIQEFLQITEHEISVVCFGLDDGIKISKMLRGNMTIVARSQARAALAKGKRFETKPVFNSYASEAARLSRCVYFPDINCKPLTKAFADLSKRSYRSVLSVPFGTGSNFNGILTINLKYPYCLAFDERAIDERLQPFVQFAAIVLATIDPQHLKGTTT